MPDFYFAKQDKVLEPKAKGFYYLYCIKKKNLALQEFCSRERGIDKKKVYALAYKHIEAVITKVDPEAFGSKGIETNFENPAWLQEKIKNHHKVIEQAMKYGSVIPLKFLALFQSEKELKNILKKQYRKFQKLLDKLRGKIEIGVKVYLINKQELAIAIKQEDKELIEMNKKRLSKPIGIQYFLEKKIQEKLLDKIDEQIDRSIKKIVQALSFFSVEKPVINKSLPGQFTDENKELVINVSFLLSKEGLEEFQRAIKRLYDYYLAKGLYITYNGPWPPYNFV